MGFEELIEARRRWVADRRREGVEGVYKAQAIALPLPPSFHDAVRVPRAERAIVAGYKRVFDGGAERSPHEVAEFVARAEAAGACAVAIWPDETAHDGSYHDILAAAQSSSLPVLSRDPVIDPVQIVMARAHGAAAVTLDVSVLNDEEFRALFRQALDLGLDVLAEAHSALELDRIACFRMGSAGGSGARLVGLSAIDASGAADLAQYERLWPGLPEFAATVATSGISTHEHVVSLESIGFDAMLVSDPLHAEADLGRTMLTFAGTPV
jgi:indole-3-glycerol phosphate synthase